MGGRPHHRASGGAAQTAVRSHERPPAWPPAAQQKTGSAGEAVEQLEPQGTGGGSVKRCRPRGKQLGGPPRIKQNQHRPQKRHSEIPPKLTGSRVLKRYVHIHAHSSAVHNRRNVAAARVSRTDDGQSVVYPPTCGCHVK